MNDGYFKHDTAVVDKGVDIGDGTKIWHFVHVSSGAKIGRDCSLGQNVFVGGTAVIGDRVKIQNNVSIFDGVSLESGVFCGPSMVFTNVINPRAMVEKKDEFRNTIVRRGASLGANCVVICGAEIGEFALVGAGAVVTRNVKAFSLVVGNPARHIGWVSEHGERLDLPPSGSATGACPASGDQYVLDGGNVVRRS